MIHQIGLLLCVATLASSTSFGQGEVEFELGLQALGRSVREGRLDVASGQLQNLWTIHARRPYLLRRRAELIEYARRIGFAMKYEAPRLAEFLPGKVLSWSESSGEVKLRLAEKDLKDYRKGRDLYSLPITIMGTHEFLIRGGADLEKHGFWMQVCVFDGQAFELEFGALIATREADGKQTWLTYTDRLYRVHGGDRKLADESGGRVQQLASGLQVRIRIGQRHLEVWRGTKKTARILLERKPRGGLWIRADDIRSLEIRGKIDRHWLEARREDWLDARWRIHLRDWKAEKEVPGWLLEDDVPETRRRLELPDRLGEEQKAAFAPLLRVWQARRWSALSRKLFYIDEKRLPPDTLLYVQALADQGLDRRDVAIRGFRQLLDRRPGFDPARSRLAEIYRRAHQGDRALALWREAMESSPRSSRPHAELARLQLLMGRRDLARRTLAAAAEAGLRSPRLQALEDTCVLIETGPLWKSPSEHRSRHYRVRSDLGEASCRKAARILESAREDFLARFPKLVTERETPYEVCLFSSQKGFATYVSRIFSRPDIHTAGLFSPILGQLLVWKPLHDDELERTLRHEAVHQLMDGKLRTAPPWLHEGLALCYEQVDRSGPKAMPDPDRKRLLSLLAPGLEDLPTLSTLFSFTDEPFLDEAARNYAWSASFVLFLLHEERSRNGILDRILEQHVAQPDPDKARAKYADELDLVELESRFRTFLERLLHESR